MSAQRSDESSRMEIIRDVATLQANLAQVQDQITQLFAFHNEDSPRIGRLETKGEAMGIQQLEQKSTIKTMQESADSVAASVATMKSILVWIAGLAAVTIAAVVIKWLGGS